MSYKRAAASFIVATALYVVIPAVALGATGLVTIVPEECNGIGGCQSVCDLAQLAQNVLNDGIYIAVFLSAVLFAWAGFMYLTNIANPGEVTRAKSIFANVAIGLVIILGSWLLVDTVMKTLTGGTLGPWNAICMLFAQRVGLA
ncbi:hypothetical protein HY418_03275 [Candidatus Kaiserbacteria bacterium]|nr:hypothetical protein [Candidatus Kaiserbacteria bacterium]